MDVQEIKCPDIFLVLALPWIDEEAEAKLRAHFSGEAESKTDVILVVYWRDMIVGYLHFRFNPDTPNAERVIEHLLADPAFAPAGRASIRDLLNAHMQTMVIKP